MNKIALTVLKEIAIGLGILVILAAVVVIAFKDQLPYDVEIREGEEYSKVDMGEYRVSSNDRTAEVTAVTITHEANSNQIVEAENEVRIQTGKYTPFGTISGTSDLPTEKVGVTVSIPEDTNSDNSSDRNEDLDYPEVESNLIEGIKEDQAESSESAATRRFNSEN